MDEEIAIILISVVMFLGCFLLGLIPLLIKLSEKRLQFVSIFGAGLLCGTALAIILPEGVELLEESWRVSSCSVAPVAANKNASDGGVGGQFQEMGPSSKGLPARFFIGVSLVLGFILMFLVDQISSYCSIHDPRTGTSNRNSITATLGLVIHAAADGVVLGVAVVSSKVTVQLVVFLAVILHKAPAAFGLVTFLLHAGLEKRQIQKHLLVFSAAAPVLSIITYFILNASGGSAQHRLSATGVGMLFSAGTFLYVATVHVLPEVSSRGQQQSFVNVISGTGYLHGTGTGQQQQSSPHLHGTGQQQQSSHHLHGTGTGQQGDLGVLESLTLILGTGLPVLLALGLHDD
ncbi:zinc transporter ZIP9 isoform X1 [Salmo salar]|uniref:Zinc transporter ZIP9 n=1 Tax=Salmo salar TaxID=8030 RepID=A0ABM3DHH3_SALSA|nr:zinc transporter ZIP9-like isoform X1 [Salmo salar]